MSVATPADNRPWLQRHLIEVAMVVLAGLALFQTIDHGLLSTQPPIDLFVYVRAGDHVLQGISPYSYPDSNHDYIYPMSFAWAVGVPLSLLGPAMAWVVWDMLSVLAMAVIGAMGVWWAGKLLRADGVDTAPWAIRRVLLLGWLAAVAWWGAHYSWGLGQAELLVSMALAGVFVLPDRHRAFGAGVLLGVGVLVKVSPIVIAPALFLAFGWRFVAGLAVMLVPYAALLLATGFWREDAYLFTQQLPVWKYNANFCDMSVYKIVCNGLFPSIFVGPDGYYGGWMTTLIQVLLLASYAATGLWLWWRRAGWLALLMVGIAYAHMVSPWLQPHHYAILIVVVAPLVVLHVARGNAAGLRLIGALFVLNVVMVESYDSGWFGHLQYLLLLTDALLIIGAVSQGDLGEGCRDRVWLPVLSEWSDRARRAGSGTHG